MTKKDEYMLDPEEQAQFQNETKGSSSGEVCPKRNPKINGSCAVCEKVSQLWGLFNSNGDKKYEKAAKDLGAKCSNFLNVVFPDNPNKLVLMEIGKKAGDQIYNGIRNTGWTDIVHPKKGIGREMRCTKSSDGGYNVYSMSPELQNADWDVPKEVLDARYNLDNIIEIIEEDKIEVFKISTLKMDESLRFRMLPAWNNDSENRHILAPLWRHWRSSKAEIVGDVEVNVAGAINDEPAVTSDNVGDLLPWDENAEKAEEANGKEACFGMDSAYDPDNDECKKCKDFKECTRVVIKKG